MSRGPEIKILLQAMTMVLVALALLGGGAIYLAIEHPSARLPESESIGEQQTSSKVHDIPESWGPRCGNQIVSMVKNSPSKSEGKNIEEAARARLEGIAKQREQELLIHGWRGREDREKRYYCRVSYRYQIGEDRGAAQWLVDPKAPVEGRLEAQERIAVEVTTPLPWSDRAEEKAFNRKCSNEGVELVKDHFSYIENFSVWRCLRKRGAQVRRETGAEIIYNRWKGQSEGPNRCLVGVDYTEDEVKKMAYFRLRYLTNGEHAVEPLTARATEAIYGPGVFNR